MPKKLIGIVANESETEGRFWVNTNYIRYYQTYGTVTLIDPHDPQVNEDLNLLVLPGGADISPGRYGMYHNVDISFPNRALETWDAITLPKYVKIGMPMYCVCRGHQSINVFFGGTLNHHDPFHPHSSQDGQLAHYVGTADKKFMAYSSSNHHQTVRGRDIAPCFTPLLWSFEARNVQNDNKKWVIQPGDQEDIVESMMHNDLPIFTSQYHAEKNYFSHTGKRSCVALENWTRANVEKIMR